MDFTEDKTLMGTVAASTGAIAIQILLESGVFLYGKSKGNYSSLGSVENGMSFLTMFFVLWLTACYGILGWAVEVSLRDTHDISNEVRKLWSSIPIIVLWLSHNSIMIYSKNVAPKNERVTWKAYANGVLHSLLYTAGISIICFASAVNKGTGPTSIAYCALGLIVLGFMLSYITMASATLSTDLSQVGYISIVSGPLLFVGGWVFLATSLLTLV